MKGLSLGLSLTGSSGAAAAFNPASLSPTAWYDPSDSATMFQDAGGATPAGVGDLTRRMSDKSGNGYHLIALGDTYRPTRQSGYLDFIDDAMGVDWASAISQPLFIAMAVKLDSVAAGQTVVDDNVPASGQRCNINMQPSNWHMFATSANQAIGAASTSAVVVSGTFDGASSVGYVNGVASAAVNPGASTSTGLRFGNSVFVDAPMDGRLYGLIVLSRIPTASERANIHTYLGAKAGLTL